MTNTRHQDTQQLPTTQLKIATLNVNGLPNDNKRMDTFELLTNRKIDIGLLKKTHSISEDIQKWEEEQKGKSLSHSRPIFKASGVTILFREDLKATIITF